MSSLSLPLGTNGDWGSSISTSEGRSSSISSGEGRGSSIPSGEARGSSISISSSGDSWGGDSWGSDSVNSRGSGSITDMLDRLSNTDRNLLNGVHRGVDGGDHFLNRVGGVSGMVDMRGLNDLLDRVDLVGSSHGDSTGHSDLIGSRNVLVDDDLTLNGGRHMDGNINIVLLHIDLRNDVGGLGSDPGVSPHGSEDLLLSDSVSRGGSEVDRCWRDGSQRCRDNGDCWGSNGDSDHGVLGRSGLVGDSGLGNMFNSSNCELVSGNNALNSGLHHLVSNNSVLGLALDNWGASSICLMGLAHNSGGRDHRGSGVGSTHEAGSGIGSTHEASS